MRTMLRVVALVAAALLVQFWSLDAGNVFGRKQPHEDELHKAVRIFVETPCVQKLFADAQQSERFWDQQIAIQTITRWVRQLEAKTRQQEEKKS